MIFCIVEKSVVLCTQCLCGKKLQPRRPRERYRECTEIKCSKETTPLIKSYSMLSSIPEIKNQNVQVDQEKMVFIKGGKFLMGSDKFYPEEKPVHEVTVDGFYIDK